jgi:cobalt-zinc-cadmium efflux system outer membrane protein
MAEAEHELSTYAVEAARLDLVARVHAAFYSVLVAQERVALAEQLHDLAASARDAVARKVEAGKVAPVESTRLQIQVSQAWIEIDHARQQLSAARAALAATWSEPAASFGRAIGELPPVQTPPDLAVLLDCIDRVPEVLTSQALVRRQELAVRAAGARAIPDLTVTVGPRHHRETASTSWVAGLAVPLPLFDRNQGERRATRFELDGARREAHAVRTAIEAEVIAAARRLEALTTRFHMLEQEVIPSAVEVHRATEIGYREGKLGLLEMLDSQRTVSEARRLRLEATQSYLDLRVHLERLIGCTLDRIANPDPRPAPAGDSEVTS